MTKSLDAFIEAYGDSFSYAFDNNIMLNWYPKRIMDRTKPEASTLELGIGHGFTVNLLSDFYRDYAVIDASPAVIAKFRKEYPLSKAKVIESYFETFSSERKYDVVVLGFVQEHVDDPKAILRHFRQFANPGARFYIAVPNAESLHRRLGHEAGLLPDIMTLGTGDLALGHKRLYSVASLTKELEDCGFCVTRKEGIFLKPFTTEQIKSLKLSQDIINGMCRVGVTYPELSAALLFEAEIAG